MPRREKRKRGTKFWKTPANFYLFLWTILNWSNGGFFFRSFQFKWFLKCPSKTYVVLNQLIFNGIFQDRPGYKYNKLKKSLQQKKLVMILPALHMWWKTDRQYYTILLHSRKIQWLVSSFRSFLSFSTFSFFSRFFLFWNLTLQQTPQSCLDRKKLRRYGKENICNASISKA